MLSTPFQTNGVAKVWVYHPVAVMFTVVGPITVVGLVGLKKVEDRAVVETPDIRILKSFIAWPGVVVTLKANAVTEPGPEPAATSSVARIKYCARPSCQYVLYGVIVVPTVGVVPEPMVKTWAES